MKIFVAILLMAAVPAYAHAQSRSTAKVSKDDAQKVVTIISGDKAKTSNLLRYTETRWRYGASLREKKSQTGR